MKSTDIPSVLTLAEECELSYWAEEDLLKELERNDSFCFIAQVSPNTVIGFLLAHPQPDLYKSFF